MRDLLPWLLAWCIVFACAAIGAPRIAECWGAAAGHGYMCGLGFVIGACGVRLVGRERRARWRPVHERRGRPQAPPARAGARRGHRA